MPVSTSSATKFFAKVIKTAILIKKRKCKTPFIIVEIAEDIIFCSQQQKSGCGITQEKPDHYYQ
jgi:hypothetical protein